MSNGRLETVQSLIAKANVIADVGCDHGLVAEYCAEHGLAKRVIASDVSMTCLNKAKSRLGDNETVSFICCDGIDYECDEAIIAGMGGMLICDILHRAKAKPATLVLCPHRDYSAVRKTLLELGYGFDHDIAVCDRGKYYFVMRAILGGGTRELDELQMLFGMDCGKKDATLAAWLKKLYNTYAVAPQANAERLAEVRTAMLLQGINPDAV